MIQTWSTGEGADEQCKKCGSVYAVKIYRMPARDSDSFDCVVCGELLRKWNDTRVPSFTLKLRGQVPGSDAS